MDKGMRKLVPKPGEQQDSGTFFSSDAFEPKADMPIQMCMILAHREKAKVCRNEESVDPRI